MRWYFLLVFLYLAGNAFADGGSVQIRSANGPFVITLFAEPPIPRAGQVDFSVLIQDEKTSQPVLDAAVTLALTPVQVRKTEQPAWYPPSCAVTPQADLARVPLLHSGAADRLLYGSLVQVPTAGVWHARVEVQHLNGLAVIEGNVDIAPPFPPIAKYWPWFLLPVAAIGLYVLRGRVQRA